MPRNSRKPRKADRNPTSDIHRRQVKAPRSNPKAGLDRHRRIDVRPPKFPGRLGGR